LSKADPPDLPSQEELRRRLRAARILRGFATMEELAAVIPPESKLGERTLRKLEYGENTITPPILRELCVALDVGYDWFTVVDPLRAVSEPDASVTARLAAHADQLARLDRELQALAAGTRSERPGSLRSGSIEEAAPQSGASPSQDRGPARRSKQRDS
jgi:hypothetical protein